MLSEALTIMTSSGMSVDVAPEATLTLLLLSTVVDSGSASGASQPGDKSSSSMNARSSSLSFFSGGSS
jgi:hypothetical protein